MDRQNQSDRIIDEARIQAETARDSDNTIAMLDRQLAELEALEARIGKAVVAIDDLRGMVAARKAHR